MLQISPTVYINPFMLDAVLSKQGEDTLYTMTEGTLHREGPTTAQLAANGFLQFGDLWINKLRIARIITATDTVYTSSGYLFNCPGANWSAVASQLSYKETTVYGYEVPGLHYVIANELPSNISGLPPELTGGTGEGGGFEMQFLGYYPTDLPKVTTNAWDVVDTTVDPITVGSSTYYHTLSYTTEVSGGTLTMNQPAGAPTHYSIVVVHTPDASPQQILNDVLTGVISSEQSLTIFSYDTAVNVEKKQGTTRIDSGAVAPFTTFSLVDGVVSLDGTPLPIQLSATELTVTVIYLSATNNSLPYSFSASGVEKLGTPSTGGYYLAASDTSAYGRQILSGEAVLFTDAPDAIVIQDYTARAASVTPLISQFISSGSNFIAAVQDIPTTPGWYLSAAGHSVLPAGRVFRVNSDLSYEYSDAPLGLRATIINGYMTHYLVADYSGNDDGLVPNLPSNWSAYNGNTVPASFDTGIGTTNRQVLVDRGSVHYFSNVGNNLNLTFTSDGDFLSNTSAYSGSIIVQGSDLHYCIINFPGLVVQPEIRAISGSGNYIIFNYIGLGGNFYITNVKPVITNSMSASFSKGNAGPVGGNWQEISNLDIDFVTLFNGNADTGTLTLDFRHRLEHKPRIVTFFVANDMLGDVIISVVGYSVTFTSPTAGQYLQVYIGGPVGLAKL